MAVYCERCEHYYGGGGGTESACFRDFGRNPYTGCDEGEAKCFQSNKNGKCPRYMAKEPFFAFLGRLFGWRPSPTKESISPDANPLPRQ